MEEVKLNISNYSKCLCPVCPVHENSRCIAAKKEKWKETRVKVGKILEEYHAHPECYEMDMAELEGHEVGKKHDFYLPRPEEMKELYCSEAVGGSNCDDLNREGRCQCPTCAVWSANILISTHYCLRTG